MHWISGLSSQFDVSTVKELVAPVSGTLDALVCTTLVGAMISVVVCPSPWLVWSFVGCFVGIFGVVVIGTASDPVTTGPLTSLVGTLETLSVADPVGAFVGTSTPPDVTTGLTEVVPPVVTCPHVSGPEPQGTGTAEVLVPETFSVVLSFPAPEVVTSTLAVGVTEPLSGVVELSPPDPGPLSVTGAADGLSVAGAPDDWSVTGTPGVTSVTDAPEVVIFEFVPLSVTTSPDVVMSTLDVLFPSTGSAVVTFVATGASVVTDPDPLSGVVELLSVPFPDIPEPLSVVWDGDSVVVSFPVIEGAVVLVTVSVLLSGLGAGASVVVACGFCVVTASVVGSGFSVGFSVTQWHSWAG